MIYTPMQDRGSYGLIAMFNEYGTFLGGESPCPPVVMQEGFNFSGGMVTAQGNRVTIKPDAFSGLFSQLGDWRDDQQIYNMKVGRVGLRFCQPPSTFQLRGFVKQSLNIMGGTEQGNYSNWSASCRNLEFTFYTSCSSATRWGFGDNVYGDDLFPTGGKTYQIRENDPQNPNMKMTWYNMELEIIRASFNYTQESGGGWAYPGNYGASTSIDLPPIIMEFSY